jgi:hypothetical protein
MSDKEPQAYQYLALGVYQQMKAKHGVGAGMGMSLCIFERRAFSYLLCVHSSLIVGHSTLANHLFEMESKETCPKVIFYSL